MGKGGKVAGKYVPLYIQSIYNKRVYKGKKGAWVKKCAERVFLIFVYRYSIIEKGKVGKGRDKDMLYIDIQNAHTNRCTFSEHTFDIPNICSNVYLFSARLCVLSAQHMNTRSYNVYAEKHMFDFSNKIL